MTRCSFIVRAALLSAFLITVAGCDKACKLEETPSTIPTPRELTGSGNRYIEMTAAALGPGSGPCSAGLIAVAAGNGTQRLLMGNLNDPLPASYDLAGWDGTKWAPSGTNAITAPPTGATEAPEGSDNQFARMANGDMLLMWNGSTKSSLPNNEKPSWWNVWGTPDNSPPPNLPANRDGYRGAQVFWRFSCATGQWSFANYLDGGLVKARDANNAEQIGYCVQAGPWVRGFDRPELYVDPWGVQADNSKQRIYVSTRCSRLDDDSMQVFMSPDSGQTWDQTGLRLGVGTPVAMTSTSTGRLIMFHLVNNTPVMHWSDDHANTLTSPAPSATSSGGFDVSYQVIDPNTQASTRLPVAALQADVTGVGPPGVAPVSLARTGPNSVLAVYPSVEEAVVNGKTIKRQIAAVVWVVPKDSNEEPIVVPAKIIRAQAEGGSVLMATFIEDDRPDAKSATSLLYWLETTSQPAGPDSPVTMVARYVTFTNGIVAGNETLLSDAAGWQTRNRKTLTALGDYMKGSFYFHNGSLNFVALWPQATQLGSAVDSLDDKVRPFIRIVTLSPPPAAPAPNPETIKGSRRARASTAPSRSGVVPCHNCSLRARPNRKE